MSPNFFVVGAPKAGTTMIYERLKRHPEVFMSEVKEPHFFSDKRERDGAAPLSLTEYLALFDGAAGEHAVGEASPSYLHSPDAPRRIAEFAPDAQIVVSLRHPVDRAYSHHLMLRQSGVGGSVGPGVAGFVASFEEAITRAAAGEEVQIGSGYSQSWYAEPLSRYIEVFGRERVFVTTLDRLAGGPDEFGRLFQFLGVDPDADASPVGIVNGGHGPPRSEALRSLVFNDGLIKRFARVIVPAPIRQAVARSIVVRNRAPREDLPAAVRAQLSSVFAEDVERAGGLAGLDLSGWTPGR